MQAGADGIASGASVEGLVLIHPYFWGKDAVGGDATEPWLREKLESSWGFTSWWPMGFAEEPRVILHQNLGIILLSKFNFITSVLLFIIFCLFFFKYS